jgi:four helix bundle protein
MKIVEEEADEAIYWLELLHESGFVSAETTEHLRNEANEILAMTVASIKTKRAHLNQEPTLNSSIVNRQS